MNLTKKQKQLLKKKIKFAPLKKIAQELNIDPKEAENYLKKIWGEEKYKRILSQTRQLQTETESPRQFTLSHCLFANWKILIFLSFLVMTVYLNSLGNAFLSDDISSIQNNPEINKISYFWKAPYFNFNLRSAFNFLIYRLFELRPLFYRLPNILFHLGSTWIAYFLISLFFASPVPLIAAAIFSVHPLLSEAVTWISGGTYSNSGFFILLAFLLYLLSSAGKNKTRYLASLFSFYFALLLSEKTFVFPIILSLYEFCLGQIKTHWRKLIPFWLLGGFWAISLLGLVSVRTASLETAFYQKRQIMNPLIQVPVAVTSYLELIFWPKNLTLYHSEMNFTQLEYFLKLSFFILFLISIFYFFKKDRRIFFWLTFFIIPLLPTLTPLGISWVVAERYVYLGSLGVFVFLAWLIHKIGEISRNQKLAYLIFGVILVVFSIRTISRNRDWQNQDTLWLAAARTSPSSPQNHNNLGDLYARHGDFEKAAEEFKKAIALLPNYGDAYHNLANVYHQMGKDELAIENYQKALSFNLNLWQSYQNIAAIYFNRQQYVLAAENLQKAIIINSKDTNLYTNLGFTYLSLGEKQKAREAFEQALRLEPQNQKAKQLLQSAFN